jgi:hypothetical protein
MISIYAIVVLLAVHWFADFVLQSDKMAKEKSKSLNVLGTHVIIYMFVLWVVSLFAFGDPGNNDYFIAASLFALSNGTLHFLTDYVTSKATSSLFKEERIHEFFVVIGLDQALHLTALFATWVYFFG